VDADVVVVGAGLAGLVASHELTSRGKKVALVDQENAANLGGQAYWSFGGIFLVDSPEQRRIRVKDSFELAWHDWQGSAGFDRLDDEDVWAAKWARAYVEFAAGEKRSWLHGHGIRFLPTVGWAERGDLTATGHGNSVPRFHITWGTGTGVVEPFANSARTAAAAGLVRFYHRHRVDELVITDGAGTGVRGIVLAPDDSPRGVASNRDPVGDFELAAQAVILTTGGIGGNHEIVRRYWPKRMGSAPKSMITGVPAHVDGRMLDIAAGAGVRLVNRDRMWHYTEGIQSWRPIWPHHAIRILPGPSSMWFDALGRRLPEPYLPGYDTLGHPALSAHHPRDRRPRPLLVHPHPADHRKRVCALRFGAKPRHHQQEPARGGPATRAEQAEQGGTAPGGGVQETWCGLRGRRQPRGTRRAHE
jgi:predicted oxidoreductase